MPTNSAEYMRIYQANRRASARADRDQESNPQRERNTVMIDIEIPEMLSPEEQRAAAAEAAVTAAIADVAAADDRLEAARAADAAGSSSASRSELAKARRQRTSAGDRAIAVERVFQQALDRLDDGDARAAASARQRAEAEAARVRTAIREAVVELLSAGPHVSRLRTAQSQAGLPQLDATMERELHDLLNAGRHLREGLDRVWRTASESEASR